MTAPSTVPKKGIYNESWEAPPAEQYTMFSVPYVAVQALHKHVHAINPRALSNVGQNKKRVLCEAKLEGRLIATSMRVSCEKCLARMSQHQMIIDQSIPIGENQHHQIITAAIHIHETYQYRGRFDEERENGWEFYLYRFRDGKHFGQYTQRRPKFFLDKDACIAEGLAAVEELRREYLLKNDPAQKSIHTLQAELKRAETALKKAEDTFNAAKLRYMKVTTALAKALKV